MRKTAKRRQLKRPFQRESVPSGYSKYYLYSRWALERSKLSPLFVCSKFSMHQQMDSRRREMFRFFFRQSIGVFCVLCEHIIACNRQRLTGVSDYNIKKMNEKWYACRNDNELGTRISRSQHENKDNRRKIDAKCFTCAIFLPQNVRLSFSIIYQTSFRFFIRSGLAFVPP